MNDSEEDTDQKENDNIVSFRKPEKKETSPAPSVNEPMINLPPVTKYCLGIIVGLHVFVTLILNDSVHDWIILQFGFIPARFTQDFFHSPLQGFTPFTHMLLHGSWLHLAMNTVMLLAFGSGVEKWIGGKKMLLIFVISGLCGVGAHFIFNLNSISPVVGASGGLSGLFAVAIIMLHRQNNELVSRYGVWPIVILWVVISIVFGTMGSPDGNGIAWAAHIGGFLGGFAALKILRI